MPCPHVRGWGNRASRAPHVLLVPSEPGTLPGSDLCSGVTQGVRLFLDELLPAPNQTLGFVHEVERDAEESGERGDEYRRQDPAHDVRGEAPARHNLKRIDPGDRD